MLPAKLHIVFSLAFASIDRAFFYRYGFVVMRAAQPFAKELLAATFDRAYTGISHRSLQTRFRIGEKPLDVATSSGFAISSV